MVSQIIWYFTGVSDRKNRPPFCIHRRKSNHQFDKELTINSSSLHQCFASRGIYARIRGFGFPYEVQRTFSSCQIYRIVANKNNIKRIGCVIFLMVTLDIIITRMHIYFSLPSVNRKANRIPHHCKILRDATYGV